MRGSMEKSPSKLRIGGHKVDLDGHRVHGADGWIHIKPRSVAVLQYLIDHAGEVCSRRDIMDGVWARVEVSEEVLNHAIHELRGAFGDDSRHPQVIETIPRGGYRLIADVQRDMASKPGVSAGWLGGIVGAVVLALGAAFWVTSGQQGSDETVQRLAVLPFETMAPEQTFDYFGDGMTEELITELNEINPDRLDVIARTSVMALKGRQLPMTEIVERLGVDYIVEGSVRREGDRVRITAQLIETEGQTHLWAESYDRQLGDILVLQKEVARDIARQARVPLTGLSRQEPRRVDPEAYRRFLRGRQLVYRFNTEAYRAALEEFEVALQREPDYAAVLGWRGMAYSGLAFSESSPERRRQYVDLGRQSAERALELNPDLGVARVAIAWQAFAFDWDFERSERLYRQGLEVEPNSWWLHWGYAELLSALGRHQEAIAQMRAAHDLDPVNPLVEVERAAIHSHAGQFRQALAIIDQGLEVMPNHQEFHDRRSNHLESLGRFEEAIETRKRYAELRGREYDAAAHRQAWREEGERGYWQYLLDAPGWRTDGTQRAKTLALLGRETEALDLLAEAVESRRPSAVFLGVYPEFESLADHPRFQELLSAAGFD